MAIFWALVITICVADCQASWEPNDPKAGPIQACKRVPESVPATFQPASTGTWQACIFQYWDVQAKAGCPSFTLQQSSVALLPIADQWNRLARGPAPQCKLNEVLTVGCSNMDGRTCEGGNISMLELALLVYIDNITNTPLHTHTHTHPHVHT